MKKECGQCIIRPNYSPPKNADNLGQFNIRHSPPKNADNLGQFNIRHSPPKKADNPAQFSIRQNIHQTVSTDFEKATIYAMPCVCVGGGGGRGVRACAFM